MKLLHKHNLFSALFIIFMISCHDSNYVQTNNIAKKEQTSDTVEKNKTNNFISDKIPLHVAVLSTNNNLLRFSITIKNTTQSDFLLLKPIVEIGRETGMFKLKLINSKNRENYYNLIVLNDDESVVKTKLRPIEITIKNSVLIEKGNNYSDTLEVDLNKTILNAIDMNHGSYYLKYYITYEIPRFYGSLEYPIYNGSMESNEVLIEL